jgi:hypothetical protein
MDQTITQQKKKKKKNLVIMQEMFRGTEGD